MDHIAGIIVNVTDPISVLYFESVLPVRVTYEVSVVELLIA